jgi:hypothetical protein
MTLTPVDRAITEAQEALDNARAAVIEVDAEIQKKENEIKTAEVIGQRNIANLERQAQDAEGAGKPREAERFRGSAAERRSELADRVNQFEAQLGSLRNQRIEVGATQTAQEARLTDLVGRAEEDAKRKSVSEDQINRAADLEDRLSRLEAERSDLIQQIEGYAPLVEAQREVATGSGSAELSKAYEEQADDYRDEWQRWLKWLGVAFVTSLVVGVIVILLAHPKGDASNATIASRIAIEILVLGLLVYAVRVTAHQFRVHRHLEAVCRGKASALLTFNRLAAGPGEAEVRTAVAVALAQAVFGSDSTGFIDSSQDGVTIVERIAGPVSQRLST